jgi:hypothetical protein
MSEPFNELRERLLGAGIAPRHVRRYLAELSDHLADLAADEQRAGRGRAHAEAAALARLGSLDDLAKAMTGRRQFQSWSIRAPWTAFGLAPLLLLAGAYFVACLVLWSGWRIFLPGTDSPFVRVDGLAVPYFGFGRSAYFGAPILIGCGISLIAVRQRLKAAWPTAGIVMIALIGSTAHVHASRPAIAGGIGHIGMGFAFGPSIEGVFHTLVHAFVIVALSLLPHVARRLGRVRQISA